ncbi:hypothetical protein WBG78_28305 [Chryseolinea sp. T2]|uniref:hypothetical protein n=1 Tax=Chryseolinea sp. T2 TaxID=3129255 RepID=UPI003077CFE5
MDTLITESVLTESVLTESLKLHTPSYSIQVSNYFGRQNARDYFHWLIILFLILGYSDLMAQSYANLNSLKGHTPEVYYSTGAEVKARRMAKQLDQVISFYNKLIGFSPVVKLLVLSPDDWKTYTTGAVYGMPHYGGSQTLFVAAEDNEFWRSFIPPTDKMPAAFSKMVSETYSNGKGGLTMEPFFDLLAIHELGHAFHIQDSLVMQRKWMGELFANILLHTYIAEVEPGLLPALTLFPEMVVATTNRTMLKYTSLEDLELHYNEIAQKFPRNYGWYQCRWHMAAASIYNEAGVVALKNLWPALKSQRTILDDTSFTTMLNTKVHTSVANVPLKWNNAD